MLDVISTEGPVVLVPFDIAQGRLCGEIGPRTEWNYYS